MSSKQPPVMTAKQAAEYLQVSVGTLYRWLREGRIPGAKLPNGQWRILKAELDAWLSPRARTNLERGQDALERCDELREQILKRRGRAFPAGYGAELIREGREERTRQLEETLGWRET